jgi:hypothetical protein
VLFGSETACVAQRREPLVRGSLSRAVPPVVVGEADRLQPDQDRDQE